MLRTEHISRLLEKSCFSSIQVLVAHSRDPSSEHLNDSRPGGWVPGNLLGLVSLDPNQNLVF